MDHKKLIKALLCDGYGIAQDSDGCGNKKCKYRDPDGACNIVSMCGDSATAITDLLARAEAAEARCKRLDEARERANEACAKWEYRAEKAEKERDAAYEAIKELTEEEDLPVAICREICENHDGMCCERAEIGIWDTCRGFKPRGQKEE